MALVTYVLLAAVIAGTSGGFDPRILGQTASKAFGLLLLEFVCIKLGCYLLGIGDEGTMVDLLAYEGYKFVGFVHFSPSFLLFHQASSLMTLYWHWTSRKASSSPSSADYSDSKAGLSG
jgi:hypothetical protein